MTQYQEFQSSIIDSMIHTDSMLDCPPSLISYTEIDNINSDPNHIQRYYTSEMIKLSAETNPPFKLLLKREGESSNVNYNLLYSEDERQELANFATIFTKLFDNNDICDKVGVVYIAKTIAFAQLDQASNLIKTVISEYENNYPTKEILTEAKRLIY